MVEHDRRGASFEEAEIGQETQQERGHNGRPAVGEVQVANLQLRATNHAQRPPHPYTPSYKSSSGK